MSDFKPLTKDDLEYYWNDGDKSAYPEDSVFCAVQGLKKELLNEFDDFGENTVLRLAFDRWFPCFTDLHSSDLSVGRGGSDRTCKVEDTAPASLNSPDSRKDGTHTYRGDCGNEITVTYYNIQNWCELCRKVHIFSLSQPSSKLPALSLPVERRLDQCGDAGELSSAEHSVRSDKADVKDAPERADYCEHGRYCNDICADCGEEEYLKDAGESPAFAAQKDSLSAAPRKGKPPLKWCKLQYCAHRHVEDIERCKCECHREVKNK